MDFMLYMQYIFIPDIHKNSLEKMKITITYTTWPEKNLQPRVS